MNKLIDTRIVIDENGEQKSSEKTYRFKSEEPNYIKIYLEDISFLYNLPQGHGVLLYELLTYISYNEHLLILNKSIKERIAKNTGLALGTINNNLQALVKKGILKSEARGLFTLNPYLFGKGDWKNIKEMRDKNIELKIIYDKDSNTRIIQGVIQETITKSIKPSNKNITTETQKAV